MAPKAHGSHDSHCAKAMRTRGCEQEQPLPLFLSFEGGGHFEGGFRLVGWGVSEESLFRKNAPTQVLPAYTHTHSYNTHYNMNVN